MQSKSFLNSTDCDIELTLYVASREGGRFQPFGTRVEAISAGTEKHVCFGDTRHPFLHGIRLVAQKNGDRILFERHIESAGSDADHMLNGNDSFQISNEHILLIQPL